MRNGNRFDPGQGTFPRLLQRAGYQTAMIGKWHLESDPVGFDHWMVLPGQGQYYNPDFLTPEGKVRLPGYCTDIITDLSLKWLEQRDPEKPFLLMCQHKAPHRTWMPGPEELGLYRDALVPEPPTLFDDSAGRGAAARQQEMEIDRHMYLFYDLMLTPTAAEQRHLQGPDRWWKGMLDRMDATQRAAWDRAFAAENAAFRAEPPTGPGLVRWNYQRYIKNYLRCVAGVDKSIGQLLAWLDAHPAVKQNTVVIYSSDQGFYLGDNGWYDKRWMYDTSMRMPLVVSWPGHVPADVRQKALVQNIDFAPTFLDLAGVPLSSDMHGLSLVPLLEGRQQPWRDALYYHYYESHEEHNVAAHYGVRTERYKLMYFYEPEHRYWELYDLQEDPDERHNLAELPAYQETRKVLTERLRQLRAQYDERTGELDPYFDVTAGIAAAATSSGSGSDRRAGRQAGLRGCRYAEPAPSANS